MEFNKTWRFLYCKNGKFHFDRLPLAKIGCVLGIVNNSPSLFPIRSSRGSLTMDLQVQSGKTRRGYLSWSTCRCNIGPTSKLATRYLIELKFAFLQ
jgi:hypothetical protein